MDDFYMPISDAKSRINRMVNIIGVVCTMEPPKMSKGTDLVVILRIKDRSGPRKLAVNFFFQECSMLPQVRSLGDILIVHDARMQQKAGMHYCLFVKHKSSFALFQWNKPDINPYQRSSAYYHRECDYELLKEMRTWVVDNPPDAVKEQSVCLHSITMDHAHDFVCKVLHIAKTSQEDWMLFVWDGTDTPPASLRHELNREKQSVCPLLDEEEIHLPIDVLCTFPYCGSVLRITLSKSNPQIAHLHGGNQWILLDNVVFKSRYGVWIGILEEDCPVCLLSDEDLIVKHRLKTYHDRCAIITRHYPMTSLPAPSPIIGVDCEHWPYTTLIESLVCPEPTKEFKSIVRVVGAYPWKTKHLFRPGGEQCGVRLNLEDPTARIYAYLYPNEAVKFFHRCSSPEVLTDKLHILLGITDEAGQVARDASRNPPWIWCCLRYFCSDESNPVESRIYKIVETKLT